MRVGIGYDIHRLVEGRKLILGGIAIPFEKGLLGHSDADVLLHAVCDSLLGAAGLGDIGLHFPDTDPSYKNISSMKLLVKTVAIVRANGFTIQNIDTIIFAEIPKIGPYRQKIQHNIAAAAEMEPNCVNVKATTTEGLGVIGKGDGIGAMSVVLVEPTLTRTSRKSETRNQKSETNTKSQFSNTQNPNPDKPKKWPPRHKDTKQNCL